MNNKSYIINEVEHLESLYPATAREKEIQQLLSFVKDGKSCQLIALPGVGRANVLGFLAYNRNIRIHHLGETGQLQYHFVLCNFSEIKNRPLFDVMKFLFLQLSSSLHERLREEEFRVVDSMFKEALSYQDELVLFQELKKAIDFLTLEKKLTVVFMLERFETYIPQATQDFFNNLRSIRSRAKYQCSFIFSVTRPLEDTLEPSLLADFYEFVVGNHAYLPLEDTVGLQFRKSYYEKLTQKIVSDKTYSQVLDATAGHGKLTRLALESIFAHNMLEDTISQEFLLSQKTIQGALEEIWRFLTPDEQQDILTLCKEEVCPLPNEFLKYIGLLHNEKIAIPLFATFIQTYKKNTKEKGQFIFDSTTNTIRRADVVISDGLTISEFRLLQLLLQHQDNVVDREQLIQAVWSDSKTQEGVSEQAVDQLVFRLRKKIEDDPTNPTHIQTVKGRGIKFVQ